MIAELKAFVQRVVENIVANVIAVLILAGIGWLVTFLWTRNIGLAISVFFNVALLWVCGWLLWQYQKLQREQVTEKAMDVAITRGKPKYDLLPDPKNMTHLNIDNALLTKLYADVRALATEWSNDAEFCGFWVAVSPFEPTAGKVRIYLVFFSPWARQSCIWGFDEYGEIREPSLPQHKEDVEQSAFSKLPWEDCPQWLEMLKKAHTQVGRLPESEDTDYQLMVFPGSPDRWTVEFRDGVSGRTYCYDWDTVRGLRRG